MPPFGDYPPSSSWVLLLCINLFGLLRAAYFKMTWDPLTTMSDGVGGGLRMGDTWTPVADSCQWMEKPTAIL